MVLGMSALARRMPVCQPSDTSAIPHHQSCHQPSHGSRPPAPKPVLPRRHCPLLCSVPFRLRTPTAHPAPRLALASRPRFPASAAPPLFLRGCSLRVRRGADTARGHRTPRSRYSDLYGAALVPPMRQVGLGARVVLARVRRHWVDY